jgi:phage tail sheath protein FI
LGGDTSAKSFDLSADFAGAFVENGDAGDSTTHASDFIKHELTNPSIKFAFPKLQLRKKGTEGGAANPYQAMYGIRPKISDSSTLHDSDYCDYLRGLPALARSNNVSPTGDYEHSITFSLDELKINETNVTVEYEEGSHAKGTAYRSSTNSVANTSGSVEDLLNLGVSSFAMPLFGGFDGLDITEIEPFNNDLMNSTDTDTTNYLANSFNLAAAAVTDEEVVPANLLLAPGLNKAHLTNKLISIADSRQDVLAIIDLEGDYKPTAEADTTDTKATRRGSVKDAVTKLKTRNIDSSFACAFYPSVQIRDRLGGSELVWIPSSIAALGAMAKSDSLTDVWFAPAGFNRGGLGSLGGPSGPTVVQARQRLDAKDRDDLYSVGINPIASFPNEGLVVFGQKTLQQRSSALDRINVRRLMLFLKREIGDVAKRTLFQNNVPATWADFKGKAEPILSDVKNRFGLTDYKLILDETTTTPDLIDRNILYAKVFLKPARAIEYIAIDFVITKTGADFV